MALPKKFKGEKYIYLLMALEIIKKNYDINKEKFTAGHIKIGDDNGMVGGQNFERRFILHKYNDKWLLQEAKSSKAFASYSKYYEIEFLTAEKPTIKEYWNEDSENCSSVWVH